MLILSRLNSNGKFKKIYEIVINLENSSKIFKGKNKIFFVLFFLSCLVS